MAVPWLDIAGAGLGLIGARSQRKAAARAAQATEYATRKQSQTLRDLAAPWQEAGKEGISKIRAAISNLFAPDLDKEDPYLAARHSENLTDIEQEAGRAEGQSKRYWGGTGNVGKARGEELLIGQSALEAKNKENLAYGEGQREVKDRNRSRYMTALSTLTDMGRTGLQPAMTAAGVEAGGTVNAANIRAGANGDMWSDLGATFGDIEGGVRGRKERAEWMDLLRDNKNTDTADVLMDAGGALDNYDVFPVKRRRNYGISSLKVG